MKITAKPLAVVEKVEGSRVMTLMVSVVQKVEDLCVMVLKPS